MIWIRWVVVLLSLLTHGNTFAAPASSYLFGGSMSDGISGQMLRLYLDDGTIYEANTASSPIGKEQGAENFGWWSDKLGHFSGIYNYFAGYNAIFDSEFRNFFAFDLSEIHGTVRDAEIVLKPYSASFPYVAVRFDLFDVSTSINDLLLDSQPNQAIFEDLGTGSQYGSRIFPVNPNLLSQVAIDLSSLAILDINARKGQYFVVGGTVTPDQSSVPEPSTMALLLLAFAAMALPYLKKKQS